MPRPEIGKVFEPRRGRRVIDRRAWACLERCRRKLGLKEIPLPIPVDEWIENPLGLRFGFQDLSYLGGDVLGATFISDREILIDPAGLEHEGRFRFTCAHELGHMTLHRKVHSVFYEPRSQRLFDGPDPYERQADRFAAAFLMPVPLLERELVRTVDQRGLKCGDAIVLLMKATIESEWLWRKVVLPALTRRFGVSLAAAVYRCSDIQPNTHDGLPLLPRELVAKLQRPADSSELDSISVDDGMPIRRDLFEGARQ